MIQRIQSLYLFMVFAINALLLITNPIYAEFHFKDELQVTMIVKQFINSFTTLANGNNPLVDYKLLNILLMGLIGIGSITAIFLFNRRKIQYKLVWILVAVNALFVAVLWFDYYLVTVSNPQGPALVSSMIGIPFVWPVVMLILTTLALMGIRKDMKILSSMDRIR